MATMIKVKTLDVGEIRTKAEGLPADKKTALLEILGKISGKDIAVSLLKVKLKNTLSADEINVIITPGAVFPQVKNELRAREPVVEPVSTPATEHLPFETPQGDAGKAALRPEETAVLEKVAAHMEPTKVEEQDTLLDAGMDAGEDFTSFVDSPEPVATTGGPVVAVYSDEIDVNRQITDVMRPPADLIAATLPQRYEPSPSEIEIVVRDLKEFSTTAKQTLNTLRVASGKTANEAEEIMDRGIKEFVTQTLATMARGPDSLDAAFGVAVQAVAVYASIDPDAFAARDDIRAIKTQRKSELSVLAKPQVVPIVPEPVLAHPPAGVMDTEKQTALENAIVMVDAAVALCNRLGTDFNANKIKVHIVENELKTNLNVLLRNLNEPLKNMDEKLRTDLEGRLLSAQKEARTALLLISEGFPSALDKTEVVKAIAGAAADFEGVQKLLRQAKAATMVTEVHQAVQPKDAAPMPKADVKPAETAPKTAEATPAAAKSNAVTVVRDVWTNDDTAIETPAVSSEELGKFVNEQGTAPEAAAGVPDLELQEFKPLEGLILQEPAKPAVSAPQVTKLAAAAQIEDETPASELVKTTIHFDIAYMGEYIHSTEASAKDNIKIGRLSTADISVDDVTVSRIHAIIERDEQGDYRISDMGSSAGTFVNGQKITVLKLKDGDQIQLGKTTFVARMSNALRKEEPAAEAMAVVAAPTVEPVVAPAAPQKKSRIVSAIEKVRTELGIVRREFVPGMKLGLSQMRDILDETDITSEVEALASYFTPLLQPVANAEAWVRRRWDEIAIATAMATIVVLLGLLAYIGIKVATLKPAESSVTEVEKDAGSKKTFEDFRKGKPVRAEGEKQ